MTLDEIIEWQESAPTQAILALYEEAIDRLEGLNIDPQGKTPEQFWQDSMKAQIGIQNLSEMVEFLSNPHSLYEELDDAE